MSERLMPPILGFQGEFRFLSNFWPVSVTLDDVTYPTTEHAYQAAKSLDPEYRELILSLDTPGKSKKLAKTVELRPDWEQVKLGIMEDLNRQKYTNHPELRAALLSTGDAYIEEVNKWGDVWWGTCNGKGRNELGLLLMRIRRELGGEA